MAASSASVPAGVGPSAENVEGATGTPATAEAAPGASPEAAAGTATLGTIPADARQTIGRPQILRGSAVTMAGFGGGQALSLVSSVVLTRLLDREAYGLYRLANVFLEGLANFTAVGSGPAIIRDQRGDDPAFLNTAWTLQAARGVGLWILACVLGLPYAWFYNQPILMILIPVVGLTVLIDSFDASAVHWCVRHVKLDRITLLEFLRQLAGLLVTVGWACLWPSVWAFTAGATAGCLLMLVLSHLILPGPRSRFHFELEAARTQYHFGKWIFVNSALDFTARQLDVLLLGRYIAIGQLGVYGLAIKLADPLASLNQRLSRQVLFPAYSSAFRKTTSDLVRAFYRMRAVMELLHLPALGFFMTAGSGIVKLLLASSFWDAGWMFQILCVRSAMKCLFNPLSACCLAIDATRAIAASLAVRTVWVVVALPFSWRLWGLYGVVWAVALSETPVLVVLYATLFRARLLRLGRELWPVAMLLLGCALGLVGARFLP
jgi:O-antigen/teichoic acid export membrane protein